MVFKTMNFLFISFWSTYSNFFVHIYIYEFIDFELYTEEIIVTHICLHIARNITNMFSKCISNRAQMN